MLHECQFFLQSYSLTVLSSYSLKVQPLFAFDQAGFDFYCFHFYDN